MKMTREHFIALSTALRETAPDKFGYRPLNYLAARNQWARTAERIADVCAVSNTSFNRHKFLEACGYQFDAVKSGSDKKAADCPLAALHKKQNAEDVANAVGPGTESQYRPRNKF